MRALVLPVLATAGLLVSMLSAGADPTQTTPATPQVTAGAAGPAQTAPATTPVTAAAGNPAQTSPAAQPATATADTESDPNRIVCRTGAPTTGTRIGGNRECHTQHVWDEMRRQAQANLERSQQIGLTGPHP
jgi:hypothetical protein